MFEIFFPISGVFFSPLLILAIGLISGLFSGLLGIGSGIIVTPTLMDFGVPQFTAITTQLCSDVGANLSNFLSYNRKQDVDFHLALYMLIGGTIGASCEWAMLKYFPGTKVAFHKFASVYVVVLIVFGSIMLFQSLKEISRKNGIVQYGTASVVMRRWMLYIPLHKVFKRSRTEMSIFVPIIIGFLSGIIVSSMGGGNNLLIAPIVTYLIGRISPVVNGTTSLVGFVITAVVTMVYAERGYACDFLFSIILFAGVAIGSTIGIKLTYNLKRYYVNALAGLTIFAMAARMIFKSLYGSYAVERHCLEDLQKSLISLLVDEHKVLYTIFCIVVVCSSAIIAELVIQKMSEKLKRKYKKLKK